MHIMRYMHITYYNVITHSAPVSRFVHSSSAQLQIYLRKPERLQKCRNASENKERNYTVTFHFTCKNEYTIDFLSKY